MLSNDFTAALINSSVVMPILSKAALERMRDATAKDRAQRPDNLLVEWILAIECFNNSASRVERVFPLVFGARDAFDSIGDLFADGIVDQIPDAVPTATIEHVRTVMGACNITPSNDLSSYTVQSVVKQLTNFLFFPAWDYKPALVAKESARRAVDVLKGCSKLAVDDRVQHSPASTASTTSAMVPAVNGLDSASTKTISSSTTSSKAGMHSLRQLADIIKEELGCCGDDIADIILEAAQTLKVTGNAEFESKSIRLQAKFIIEHADIDLSNY